MDKIVVSDTSCLIALDNLGLLHILKDLFNRVLITQEVSNEFGKSLPGWLMVKKVTKHDQQQILNTRLDKGEASSIALALELEEPLLIIDERKGRAIAKSMKIEIIGTLGILILARQKGVISNIIKIIKLLQESGFRVSKEILQKIRNRYSD